MMLFKLCQRFVNLLMPYDLYERHAVVGGLLREVIEDEQGADTVLDVGGRAELLKRFLSCRAISVNTDGTGELTGSGFALPFADNTFAAIVSIDTVEHLPQQSRLPFLQECLRVARRWVLVAAPLGSRRHYECEYRLHSLYQSVHGEPHVYLGEHLRYGLPDLAQLDQFASDLPVSRERRLFAGDLTWQAKQFERAILGHRRRGALARLSHAFHHAASWALFHPVRLRERPGPTTNRFYWLMEKKPGDSFGERLAASDLQIHLT